MMSVFTSGCVVCSCAGTAEFVRYIEYCRGLEYEETPDYDYLRSLLQQAFEHEHLVWDFEYDWVVQKKVCSCCCCSFSS